MKIKSLLSIAMCICAAWIVNAQNPGVVTTGNPGVVEQNLNQPDADTIYVGRYGYWRNMPVKVAYFGYVSGKKLPDSFQLRDEKGKTVFTNNLELMRTPGEVLAPVGQNFPGEKIYALNFSKFDVSGNYYIVVPGFGRSDLFKIGGNMPVDIFPLPSLKTFEEQSHIINNNGKPIIQDSFLKTPLRYPIDTTP